MRLRTRKTGKLTFCLLFAVGIFSGLILLPSFHTSHHAKSAETKSSAETPPVIPAPESNLGASGLPIPRFASLKPARVNTRVGPSRDYGIAWLYTKSGLPVEIIQEYDNWRRIRDADGTEGWVYQSLLAGKRTAIIAPWDRDKTGTLIDIYASANQDARVVARLEPGVISSIRECTGQWCQLDVGGIRGWINQTRIWGAYPDEVFD